MGLGSGGRAWEVVMRGFMRALLLVVLRLLAFDAMDGWMYECMRDVYAVCGFKAIE